MSQEKKFKPLEIPNKEKAVFDSALPTSIDEKLMDPLNLSDPSDPLRMEKSSEAMDLSLSYSDKSRQSSASRESSTATLGAYHDGLYYDSKSSPATMSLVSKNPPLKTLVRPPIDLSSSKQSPVVVSEKIDSSPVEEERSRHSPLSQSSKIPTTKKNKFPEQSDVSESDYYNKNIHQNVTNVQQPACPLSFPLGQDMPLMATHLPIPSGIPDLLPIGQTPLSIDLEDEENRRVPDLQFKESTTSREQIGQRELKPSSSRSLPREQIDQRGLSSSSSRSLPREQIGQRGLRSSTSRSSPHPNEKRYEVSISAGMEEGFEEEENNEEETDELKGAVEDEDCERRRKNNEDAESSPEAMSPKEEEDRLRLATLQMENMQLRQELNDIKNTLKRIKAANLRSKRNPHSLPRL